MWHLRKWACSPTDVPIIEESAAVFITARARPKIIHKPFFFFSPSAAVIDASIYFSKCSSRGPTWFKGHELHFVQVRVKGSCQTKIPNWRHKWTVDNTDMGCVFIPHSTRLPLLALPPSVSGLLCSDGSLKGRTLPDCERLAGRQKRNQACKTISQNWDTQTHTFAQVLLSYFLVLTLCHLLHSRLLSWLDRGQGSFRCLRRLCDQADREKRNM